MSEYPSLADCPDDLDAPAVIAAPRGQRVTLSSLGDEGDDDGVAGSSGDRWRTNERESALYWRSW